MITTTNYSAEIWSSSFNLISFCVLILWCSLFDYQVSIFYKTKFLQIPKSKLMETILVYSIASTGRSRLVSRSQKIIGLYFRTCHAMFFMSSSRFLLRTCDVTTTSDLLYSLVLASLTEVRAWRHLLYLNELVFLIFRVKNFVGHAWLKSLSKTAPWLWKWLFITFI